MLPTPPRSPKLSSTCFTAEDRLGWRLADRYELISVLGVGAYGVVYQAVDVHTNILYAVKALPKYGLDLRQQHFQRREIALHYQASEHPNIVSLDRVLESQDCTYVVLEYCPEGDLFSNITEQGHFIANDRLAKHVFLQIVDAVQHCHNLGIYHRDLKPENILVTDHGRTVKLADFGLATTDKVTPDFGCGSTFYMSPECQTPNKSYGCYASAPNDVWSLGVILVNLTCGRNPWKKAALSDSTFRAFKKNQQFLSSILPISPELNLILGRIFDSNPQTRISLHELRHLVLACPRFTMSSYHELPPSPIYGPCDYVEAAECANMALPPSPPTSPHNSNHHAGYSQWSLDSSQSKQDSGCSSTSTNSDYDMDVQEDLPQPYNIYGNLIQYHDYHKQFVNHHYQQPAIATY